MTNEKSAMRTDETELNALGPEELQSAAGGSAMAVLHSVDGVLGGGIPDGVLSSVAGGIEDAANTVKNVAEAGASGVAKGAEWVGDEASKAASDVESGIGDLAKGIWENWN